MTSKYFISADAHQWVQKHLNHGYQIIFKVTVCEEVIYYKDLDKALNKIKQVAYGKKTTLEPIKVVI